MLIRCVPGFLRLLVEVGVQLGNAGTDFFEIAEHLIKQLAMTLGMFGCDVRRFRFIVRKIEQHRQFRLFIKVDDLVRA